MATAFFFPTELTAMATIGDPEGTRTVTSLIALLVALGIGLVMVAVWLYRTTRPDPELLAPLEVMGERKWRRSDPVAQRRGLDGLRPDGAEPMTPSAAPPDIDEAFERGPQSPGFDDLHNDLPTVDGGRDPVVLPPVIAGATPTPQQIDRPPLEDITDLLDKPIDPAVLAAAEAALDAELAVPSDGSAEEPPRLPFAD